MTSTINKDVLQRVAEAVGDVVGDVSEHDFDTIPATVHTVTVTIDDNRVRVTIESDDCRGSLVESFDPKVLWV